MKSTAFRIVLLLAAVTTSVEFSLQQAHPISSPANLSPRPTARVTNKEFCKVDGEDDRDTPYTYTSSTGFEVTRPKSPSAAVINSLPRRLFITTTFLTIPLALGSNFLGVTSRWVISSPLPMVREFAEALNLNALYPDSEGYKVFISPKPASSLVGPVRKARYRLTLPPRFVQDPAVALAKAQATDPNREMKIKGGASTIPDVAFGPMGKIDPITRKSSSDINISVITSPVDKGFNMDRILGGKEPTEAGQTLIDTFLCGPGSGRQGKLVEAKLVERGREMFSIEYIITKPGGKQLRSISLLAPVGGELVTFTVVGREGEFDEAGGGLRRSAESFVILD